MAKKVVLEDAFVQLESIIDALSQGDLTLEESFRKYEDGMKLIKSCNASIDRVEKRLIVLEQGKEEETEA